MLTMHCIVGPVGSGKTTFFNKHDPEQWVRYSPGQTCRSSIGTGLFRRGDRPNAPAILDDFVFSMMSAHIDLALALNRPCVAEFPRTQHQAKRFLELVNQKIPPQSGVIIVHRLFITKETWEQRLGRTRWKEDPQAEQMDRVRFHASVRDSVESVAFLASAGIPYVVVQNHSEDRKNEVIQWEGSNMIRQSGESA